MLTKDVKALMQKRQKLLINLHADTCKLIQKRDALQAEIDKLSTPKMKKIEDLKSQIIQAAEQSADDIFDDAKKHEHAGQVLALTSGKSIECAESETDVIAALENVKGKNADLAERCLKHVTTLNKNVIKAEFEGNEAFFAAHSISFKENSYITLKDAA